MPRKRTLGRSKYGAVPTIVDNVRFASKKEAARYLELKVLQNSGVISGLQLQPAFNLEVNGQLICRYKADFRYWQIVGDYANNIVEDAKGFKTPEYKLKKKLMKACHGIEIQEV